jgi:hypothetical protein
MTGHEFQLGDTVAATTRNGRVHTGTITLLRAYTHFTLVDVIDSDDYTLVFRLPELKLIKEAASDDNAGMAASHVSADPCDQCADDDHEGCRDGTRISSVPYTCPCAVNRHA